MGVNLSEAEFGVQRKNCFFRFFRKNTMTPRKLKNPDLVGFQSVWILIIMIFFLVGSFVSKKAFAERKPTIVMKQTSHDVQKENFVHLINPSGDPYDSFRSVSLEQLSGLPISVPIDANNNGMYVIQVGVRALPVKFECDYSQGITRGEALLSYRHPRSFYNRISDWIVVECLPMTEEVKAQHIAIKEQHLREDSLKRVEEERILQSKIDHEEMQMQLQAQAEAVRREKEAKEIARQASPLYKRELAEQNIKRMHVEIRAAEVRIIEERRVGNLSGYVDKRRLHELGSFIVAAEREIARNWVIYRENGGAARSVESIR